MLLSFYASLFRSTSTELNLPEQVDTVKSIRRELVTHISVTTDTP